MHTYIMSLSHTHSITLTHTYKYTRTHTHTPPTEERHGCCWKAFHTDPQGSWYKPHKAGPVSAILLVVGWILFIVLCGWVVALAMILVFILIGFAYVFNFICTGRCQIEEDDR